MGAARDLDLAARADETAAALAGRAPLTQFALAYAREAVLRHRDLTYGIMTFPMTYRPDMPEAELRAWAAELIKALNDGQ